MKKTALLLFLLLSGYHLFSQGFSKPFGEFEYYVRGIDLNDGYVYTSGLDMVAGGIRVYKFNSNGDTTSLLNLQGPVTETDVKVLPDTSLLVFAQFDPGFPNYGKILLVKLGLDGTFIDSLSLPAWTDNNNQFTPIVDEGFVYFMMLDTVWTDIQHIVKTDLDLNVIYKQPAPEAEVHVGHRSLEIAPDNDLYIFSFFDSALVSHFKIHHFDNNGNFQQTFSYPGIEGIPVTEGTQFILNDSTAAFYQNVPLFAGDNYRYEFNLNTGAVTDVNTHGYYLHNMMPVANNRYLCTIQHMIASPSQGYTYLAIVDSDYSILRYNVIAPFDQYINYIAYRDGLIALSYKQSQLSGEIHVALFDTLLNPILGNVHGEVYNDLDNTCDDLSSTDIPLNNSLISAQSTNYHEYAFPISGQYSMFLLEDIYDVSSGTPDGFEDNCTNNYNINLNPGDTFHLDFFKDQREHDLSLDAASNGFIAALQTGSINLSVDNPGFFNVTGYTLKLVNDTLVDYASASPVPDVISGDTLIWNMLNIIPGTTDIFTVNYTIPPSTVAGTILEFTSNIQSMLPTDEYSPNNFDTLETVVFNSYDPNIKIVNPLGETSYGIISRYQELEYTVHFQNTGNFMAYNIFVTDMLDADLDLGTLEITGASHPYEARINGNELRMDFKNIMLADSTSNEPASHGYFTYKITPKINVVQGATIENSASIYFDFNSPIVTNQTYNTIESPMGIEEEEDLVMGKLYPNPATEWITLEIAENNLEGETIDIHIMDLQGRTLQSLNLPTQVNVLLNISEFPSGVYLIKAGKTRYKFIKG